MPDVYAQLLNALFASGLEQYPDPKVYRAAKELKPEDRPKAQVLTTDPDPKKYPVFRVSNPGAFAGVSHTEDGIKAIGPIVVNRKSTEYGAKDPLLLASVLAHEGQHYVTGSPEAPAYQKAIDFLQGTRLRDSDYVKTLIKVAQKYKNDTVDKFRPISIRDK